MVAIGTDHPVTKRPKPSRDLSLPKPFALYAFHIPLLESLHQNDPAVPSSLFPVLHSFVQQRDRIATTTAARPRVAKQQNSSGSTCTAQTTTMLLLIPQRILALQQTVDERQYDLTVAPWRNAQHTVQDLVKDLGQQVQSLQEMWWEEQEAHVEKLLAVDVEHVNDNDDQPSPSPPSEQVEKLRTQIELWEKLLADFRSVLGEE